MDKRLRLKVLCFAATLLFSFQSFAQLPAFNFGVTPTAQTCLGNGSLSFTVSGLVPGASVDYTVYLLPDTTTPLTVVTSASVGGLVAGNYLVVATQSLSGETSTQSQNVTIADSVVPLAYTIVPTAVRCGNDGVLTINVITGTAVTYEIMSGPVTHPPQASNVFSGLPPGTYQVRVHDNCGEAVVLTYQILQTGTALVVNPGGFPDEDLPSCDHITIEHTVSVASAGNQVVYPISYQITVFPPGGGAQVIVTGTVISGSTGGFVVSQEIPFYTGQYSYNIRITDACGNVYSRNNNIVNRPLMLSVEQGVANCGDNAFIIHPVNYVGPFTVTFTTAPTGFDPVSFNPLHPTFSADDVPYGDLNSNPVPEGNYAIQVTDACGRTATRTFVIEDPDIDAEATPIVIGCNAFGSVSIAVPWRQIVSVVFTAAPAAYPGTLPDDVSSFIGTSGFVMDNLPLGNYVAVVTDSCGDTYTVPFELATEATPLSISQNPGCETGFGSIRISATTTITSAIITSAPAAFQQTLPLNVSSNISSTNGRFYMNSLPEGVYIFRITDQCGAITDQQVIVEGYHIQSTDVTLAPGCAAFALNLLHLSNGNNLQSFWLQKFNETDGVWEHPITGLDYTEGTTPTLSTGYPITNNSNNPNITSTGHFRILKLSYIYSNGSAANFRCLNEIYEFDFEGGPVITDAYSFPCAGGLTEVVIVAEGIPPLTYGITTKNGAPFVVNNGTSNLFSGLEPATYNFRVTDMCGNIRNIQFDINALDPIAITAQGFCENEASSLAVEEFSFLNYEWWEAGSPGTILSTTGTLSFPSFNSANDAGTYVVSITSDVVGSCVNQLLQYEVLPNTLPNAGNDNSLSLCNDGQLLNLADYLSAGHDAGGVWEDTDNSGGLTGQQLSTTGVAEGTYRFVYKVTGVCSLEDEATVSVELKNRPQAPIISPVPAVCAGTPVQFSVTPVTDASYQWSGPGNFSSVLQNPAIPSAAASHAGVYSLTVTVNGCTSPPAEVALQVNPVPQFTLSGNTLLCAGQSTALSVVPDNFTAGAASYKWYQDGIEMNGTAQATLTTTTPATYKVEATLNGCIAEREITVTENTNVFTVALDSGCRDLEYMIWITSPEDTTGMSYSWAGPDGFTASGSDATITNLAGGEYSVVVTDANGCSESASITVDNTTCFIPRGISPNGDQMNDNFDLSNLDIKHIVIFNRYGLEVYEQDAYIDEWHGQSHRGELPTGTYYYVLTLSEGKRVTGWVYLQRQINR